MFNSHINNLKRGNTPSSQELSSNKKRKSSEKSDPLEWVTCTFDEKGEYSKSEEYLEDDINTDSETDSEGETDPEDEIILSINGQYTLKKEPGGIKAIDLQSEAIFFVSNSGQLHVDQQTSMELGACGGNIYALLMGEAQPFYFVAQDRNNLQYYRVGSKVDYIEEAEGENIFRLDQPVSHFIFSLVISYLLGDDDISNVVAVQKDHQLRVVRLDPELCFSDYFFNPYYNNQASILAELSFLAKLNDQNCSSKEELDNLLLQEKEVVFFRGCFNHKLIKNSNCLKLLGSSAKDQELFAALDKIIKTPFQYYEAILNSTISNNTLLEKIKNTLKNRLEIFKQVNELVQKKSLDLMVRIKDSNSQMFFSSTTARSLSAESDVVDDNKKQQIS